MLEIVFYKNTLTGRLLFEQTHLDMIYINKLNHIIKKIIITT